MPRHTNAIRCDPLNQRGACLANTCNTRLRHEPTRRISSRPEARHTYDDNAFMFAPPPISICSRLDKNQWRARAPSLAVDGHSRADSCNVTDSP